jgi:hypothetical protein
MFVFSFLFFLSFPVFKNPCKDKEKNGMQKHLILDMHADSTLIYIQIKSYKMYN